MRASSSFILIVLTFVLGVFAWSAPKTSLPKANPESDLEDDSETPDFVKMDSLSLPGLKPDDSNIFSEPAIFSVHSTKTPYFFYPALSIYSGPTATKDNAAAALIGLYFENIIEDYEAFRLGFSIASTADSFLMLSHQFQLYPKTWGTPYWNLGMNFGIDSTDAFGSFTNMNNFNLSLGYGAKLNRTWKLEGAVGILSLRGISLSLTSIYTLSL